MKRFTAILKCMMLVIIIATFTNAAVSQTPTYKLYFTNVVSTPNTVSWDVYLLRTGTTPLQLAAIQFGFGYDVSILNSGTVTAAILPGSDLPTAMQPTTIQSGTVNYSVAPVPAGQIHHYINIFARPEPGAGNGPLISNISSGCAAPGTKICRVQLTNSVNWAPGSQMSQVFSQASGSSRTRTAVFAYIGTTNTDITDYSNHLSYNVTGTCDPNIALNGGGCTFTASASTTAASCSSNGTATITLFGSNAATQGSYTVDAGATQTFSTNPFIISGLAVGNHVISVSSASGCMSNAVNITIANAQPITATAAKQNSTACNSVDLNSGSINVSPAGGLAPYSYSWSGPNGFTGTNSASVTGLAAGSYSVTITDANSCGNLSLSNIVVGIQNLITVTTNGSVLSSCGSNGSISLQGNGGAVPYSYSLDNINYQSSNTFNGLSAGSFTGYAKDANGCIGSKAISISQPVISVTSTGSVLNTCSNTGSINLQATGGTIPYIYSLDGINYQAGNIFNNLAIGSYTAYVKDANGCIGTKSITIGSGVLVNAATGGITTSCINNGTEAVQAAGGVKPYSFSLDGINYTTLPAPGSTFTFSNLASGSFIAYVKDATGCMGTDAFLIARDLPPSFNRVITPSSSCVNNGSITMSPGIMYTSGPPFTYSLDNITYQSSGVFTGLAPGSHTGYIKDGLGCVGSSAFTVGQVQSTLVIRPTTGGVSNHCVNTGYESVGVSGGVLPYSFSLDGINFVTIAAPAVSISYQGLAPGDYTVYVKDAAGCQGTAQFHITTEFLPTFNATVTASSSCANNGSIRMSHVTQYANFTPFTYSLDNITYQSNPLFTGLAAGTYTGYIRDGYGCTGTGVAITVPGLAAVSVTARFTNASTCINNGTIQANDPVGGTAPFTYSLDGITYQTSKSFANLAAGTYTLTAKDVYGCTGTTSVTITSNPINVTSYVWNAGNCIIANGQVRLFLTGGVSPYSYSLDGNTYQSSPVFSSLSAGTYTGYVKDGQNCVGMNTNIVVGPAGCRGSFTANNINTRQTSVTEKTIALNVQAYPNPSEDEFTVVLEGFNSKEKVLITVTDVLGRNVYQKETTGKSQYTFGKDLKTGIYIVQVIQGNEKKSLKIIKE